MFKDHFSDQSGDYLRYRPSYPGALFAFLAEIPPMQHRAWDCATGSGQAAHGLSTHFERVIATDASAAQIDSAVPAANVHYRVAPAEASGLPDRSVDLVTVAQALHWLDLERFYGEVRRVLKPGGLLAVWSYNLLRTDPAIDAEVDAFYSHTVGPYWPPERRLVESGYRDLPFPFPELDTPPFAMTARWRLEQLLGYLGTWSATKRYRGERR
ncbi:MAG: class I SAM-dependent methyltransferase, partial [bacterium]|nr:class I SAM-dependent methyltransferase [bacterium]